jgi:basic membrane protein A and related proteins
VLCLFAMIAYHACTRFTPLLLVMLVLLGGCLLLPRMGYATDAESSIPAVAVESNFRPAIIYEFSGKKGDKGFIDLVRKGAQRAKQEVGIDYQEFQIEAGQDRMEVFKDILRQGFTHIIAVGFQNMVPVLTVADKYPEVKFTVIDGIIPGGGNCGECF